MAIGLRRKVRLDSRRANQQLTRLRNGVGKQKERVRREERILARLKSDPERARQNPAVQSWLSARLGKRYRQITDEDIKRVTA